MKLKCPNLLKQLCTISLNSWCWKYYLWKVDGKSGPLIQRCLLIIHKNVNWKLTAPCPPCSVLVKSNPSNIEQFHKYIFLKQNQHLGLPEPSLRSKTLTVIAYLVIKYLPPLNTQNIFPTWMLSLKFQPKCLFDFGSGLEIRQFTIWYAGSLGHIVDQASDVPSIFFSWFLAKFFAKILSIYFLILFIKLQK